MENGVKMAHLEMIYDALPIRMQILQFATLNNQRTTVYQIMFLELVKEIVFSQNFCV